MSESENHCQQSAGSCKSNNHDFCPVVGTASDKKCMLLEDCDTDAEKLRGDAIGSTLYSERWLLKVLISLSEFQEGSWCELLEEHLCSLWDMTFETDVILLLMKHDFIQLVNRILQTNAEPRLTEILVGILGNMTSHKDVRSYLSQSSLSELLLSLLDTPDTLTLVQLVRLLNSCVWHMNRDVRVMQEKERSEEDQINYDQDIKHWITLLTNHSSVLNKKLSFILTSSTNEDLLLSSLELLSNLCSITIENSCFSEYLSSPEIVAGLLEGLHQLVVDSSEDGKPCFIWGEKAEKASQLWASVINSFCLHNTGQGVIYSHRQNIMRCICSIIDPLGSRENLLPLDSRKLDILESLVNILESLQSNQAYIPPGMLPRLLTILPFLCFGNKDADCFEEKKYETETGENVESCDLIRSRILNYCISNFNSANTHDLIEAFGENPQIKIKSVLSHLIESNDIEISKIVSMVKTLLL